MALTSNCTPSTPSNGVLGGNFDVYGSDRTIPRSMTAFTAIAWYNCIVILIFIFVVFKRYSGLYFWSLLITTLAVVPYSTGSWLKQNSLKDSYLIESLITVGWVIMIPGQSLVLYSRLHLITQNWRLLRFILWLIIVDSVCLIPTSVTLGWTAVFGHNQTSLHGYGVFEKIQMTLFTVQELIISGVYLWEGWKVFDVILKSKTKSIIWQVIAFNIFIICLDATLLTIEFFNLFMIETTFKSFVYSAKLLVEFGVLSRMVNMVKGSRSSKSVSDEAAGRIMNAEPEKLTLSTTSEPLSPLSTTRSGRYPPLPTKDECRDLRGLQQNVPTEWRLSIGNEPLAAPDLLEIQQNRRASTTSMPSSTENLYPGILNGTVKFEDAITIAHTIR